MRITSSHSFKDRGLDAYFTPIEATLSLLAIEPLPKVLWEPACGNGAIVKPLRRAGHTVFAADIHQYDDFDCEIVDYFKASPYAHAKGIVTNPPFRLAIDFAKKALSEVPYLALLLRTNFLESQDRLSFFRQYPFSRIWISSRRLPQMHRYGWTGPEAPSNICYAWFIWDERSSDKRVLDWFDWANFSNSNTSIYHRRTRSDLSQAIDLDDIS